jgi:hypothetical protein
LGNARKSHLKYCRQRLVGVSTARLFRDGVVRGGRRLAGGVESPPAVLHSSAVRVRVAGIGVHDPTLRAAAAHDAAQEHRAAIARNRVVVPRHVTIDPTPHNHLPEHRCAAEWQGQCQVHGRLPYMKTCAESTSGLRAANSIAQFDGRSCTRNYAFEMSFHNRRLTMRVVARR